MPDILSCFENLTLTNDQREAALAIETFLNGNDPVFILKGYAGTGKTTLLGGICQYITNVQGREVRLMAPTGRAARVLGDKNKSTATTIHRGIYNFHELETEEGTDEQGKILDGFQFVFKLASDADIVRQVFVIDEASMVSDAYAESEFFRFGSGFLLRDLLAFAKVGLENVNTQLIFVGDPAQLPPFGMGHSPALSEAEFEKNYRIQAQSVELREVVRQGGESGVLALATQIRQGLASGYLNQFEIITNGRDVQNVSPVGFWNAYDEANANKIIITYQNKTAKEINNRVRATRFGADAPALMPGDMIIVGQNNYQHGVTNGTFGMIQTVGQVETRTVFVRGERPVVLRWQSVEVLVRGDDTELRTIQAKTLLNFLESDESRLNSAEMRGLFVDFSNRMTEQKIKRRTPEFADALKVDEYFTALMLKHAYAITCHKAQGGEWKSVFTVWDKNTKEDFNPFADEQPIAGRANSDFFRWAYTAITRSSHQLVAVNPPRLTPFAKLSWIDTGLAAQLLASQGIETKKLIWGQEQQTLITWLGLVSRALFVQHKIAALAYCAAEIGVDIETVRSSQYLETVTFSSDNERVVVNFWYNGKQKFTRYQKAEGSEVLFSQIIEALIQQAGLITFELPFMSLPNEPMPVKEFSNASATSKPFVDLLQQKLNELTAPKAIRLAGSQSLEYRERSTFERGAERVVLDFIYDGDGFFTEVRAVPKQSTSDTLLADLKHLVQTLRA